MPQAIFITGAGAGIGAETARLFARQGWIVGASDLAEEGLQALRSDIGGDRLFTSVADVRDPASVQAAVREFTRLTGGRLDAAFANAGVLYMGPDHELTPAQKQQLIDVNVRGVVNTVDAVFPWLRVTPGAHLVAMASTSAEYGAPLHAVYSATKFFVRGYTEALNLEYRPHGIQVSAIYVAYVQTGMVFDANARPATIDALGVKVRPQQVAEHVWKAVHGARVHWYVGLDARAINLAVRLLGSGVAPIFRRLAKL